MEAKTLFKEKQQFRQWWLWLGLIALNGFVFYKIFIEKDYGNAKNWVELLPVSILLILALLFWFVKMETEIKEDGIYVSFYPLLTKTKFYPWGTIEKVKVIKNHPALKYGGWGVRIGGYNVSGSTIMQLELKSGNKLFIGTQQPDEIQVVLNNLKK